MYLFSLGNPNKGAQRFVDAIVLISAADVSKTHSNCENVVHTPFESAIEHGTTLCFAKLCYLSFVSLYIDVASQIMNLHNVVHSNRPRFSRLAQSVEPSFPN